jgi:spore coat polysaccharide biosynthesis predicted glycosyltransferase SpsG
MSNAYNLVIALCIESSHKKGMGHLFRALNIIDYLRENNNSFVVFINEDKTANNILDNKRIPYELVNLPDTTRDWETVLIKKYGIDIWINDRLDTCAEHAKNVVKNMVQLITFDDKGSGAEFADIHVAAMIFTEKDKKNIKGKKVLHGIKYLILNKEIDKYKRIRDNNESIIVTLGGSDTYGVSVRVLEFLRRFDMPATIVLGPSFEHKKELYQIIDDRYCVKEYIPSLIKECYNYDLAITGGGITPFEANAAGLPCIIIASEAWEIDNGQYLDTLGSSKFAGFRTNFKLPVIKDKKNLERMSDIGIKHIDTNGIDRIFDEVFC